MNLSEISIRRPVFAWMLMMALIVFGALSFRDLGLSQLPDVDFPVVSVSLSLPGAAPEVMESQVVDPVEDAIMGIEGIRDVTSHSSEASASISVEFDLSRNIDSAVQEVETRIAQVQNVLPADMQPVSVRKVNPEDQPILRLVLTSKGDRSRASLMSYARNTLFDQFSTVPGVGDIGMSGYVDPNLRVWLSLEKLKKYELTASDVITAIENEHSEIPIGRLENSKNEINLRLLGEARTVDEFGKILLSKRSSGLNYKSLMLKDVATIKEDLADVRRLSRYSGVTAVGLEILKQHGSNAVGVAKAVRERLKDLQGALPSDLVLDIRQDTTTYITDSVHELEFTLILAALLTSLVCYLFLGSWTSTINVLMAIPTSIVGTFIVLKFFNFTLNTFTLLGLSLAIGIVVDDAIMMLENIVRHREKGESRRAAALKGSKEITFAAIAATLAIAAIFIPVVFMSGIMGRYFYQYGITVTAAVLLSLLEALTLTPMRCSRYLTIHQKLWWLPRMVDAGLRRLEKSYASALAVTLNHRWKVVLLALTFFGGSLFAFRGLKTEMVPAQDQSQLLIRLKGPVDSSLDFTDVKTMAVEDFLAKQSEVASYSSAVGGFGGDAVNQAMIFVTLKSPGERKLSQQELVPKWREEMRTQVKGIQVVIQDMSTRGFSSGRGFPVEFTVQGPDWATLGQSTTDLIETLNESKIVAEVNTDYQLSMPELKIIPNRRKMSEYAVNLATVTKAVNQLVGGALLPSSTRYSKDGARWDIRVRLLASDRSKTDQLQSIRVPNNRGELIPLSDLVDVKQGPSLSSIYRRNRERALTVYGNLVPGHSQKDAMAYVQETAKKVLPDGYHLLMTGSSQTFKESFRSLIFALGMGIVVAYMVLASQFNSFLHPVTVLLALPFSLSGAVLALRLADKSLNVFSMIALILLMGIVKKNSILLVDFTNQMREKFPNVREALLHACPIRLRPILMTSVATIAGAFPAALALGPGAETHVPMAIALIGGVLVSTLLTLFVVPCSYSLFDSLRKP